MHWRITTVDCALQKINGEKYYQGQNVDEYYDMLDIRWYSENFEICDAITKLRKESAMRQPYLKKLLSDSLSRK